MAQWNGAIRVSAEGAAFAGRRFAVLVLSPSRAQGEEAQVEAIKQYVQVSGVVVHKEIHMPKFSRYLAAVAVIFCLLNTATVARGGDTSLAGDILTGAIPLSALALAYFKGDTEGEKQWLRNVVANQLLTSAARLGFNQTSWGERPNGHRYGFPSGHVAFVASGASFLQERYGWQYGVPAWLLTGYVAYNRVENGHHHWRDVIASGAVAYGVGKLFVTPEIATYLAPVVGPDFIGMRFERSW